MGVSIYTVDAFTSVPFKGNPAAVCLLAALREAEWMRDVAREMSLSETAFVLRRDDGFGLRWFTSRVEVDLCGHATLASAHVLWEAGWLQADEQARFHTRSGLLKASRLDGGWIELDFPSEPPAPVEPPPDLLRALGVKPVFFGKGRDYLVEVESEEAVRRLELDFALLAGAVSRGVIVTSRAACGDYDFVSRFFAPSVGINEDPVTGSAHCCLGSYWGDRLKKDTLVAYQASAWGGVLRLRVAGPRVFIGGQAVTVLRGELVA